MAWLSSSLRVPEAKADSWAAGLSASAADALTAKVICVCAGLGISVALDMTPAGHDGVTLMDSWLDEPTERAFNQVVTVYHDERVPDVVAQTARVAMSSVGNDEESWRYRTWSVRPSTPG